MRILFVAMPNSIHTARWISQLRGQDWDVHLFPVFPSVAHPDLKNVVLHDFFEYRAPHRQSRLSARLPKQWWFARHFGSVGRSRAASFLRRYGRAIVRRSPGLRKLAKAATPDSAAIGPDGPQILLHELDPQYPCSSGPEDAAFRLAALIEALRPDIGHSLETQHGGYLVLGAQRLLGERMPTWMHSNWGSDLFLFGRQERHARLTRAVMETADYYCCESQRDARLGREFGFRGKRSFLTPSTGGFHLDRAWKLRQPGPPSARRRILLKGYQHWAGRALVGLQAIELVADLLGDYRVQIYSVDPYSAVPKAAEALSKRTGIDIELLPQLSHDEMLQAHGAARVSLALSISDGVPVSFLEALLMGAFPIQSNTSCANEWIEDRVGGWLVPPEDPGPAADAIRKALLDDALVDAAAAANAETARRRLDYPILQRQAIQIYQEVRAECAN